MIGPTPGLICGDEIGEPFARLHQNGVLVGSIIALAVIELAPETVQMDGMLHHAVIDEHETDALPLRVRHQGCP